ncbi:hypothetical protein BW14_06815 [Bifidobacterium sp. UTBIF-68]|uniref:hypothetical protein n=1 Tax=Bifidobacterium sp. UTBIF-68 TaxID=1465262 RepID=UPI001129D6FD|nr:hypothetical protein [Bifidobacterium sp. UTBIF-68]TPF92870.1 hypothetical protein BW14_06815 [Bifidobacterium sp. UTBIF-68]
MDGLEGYEGSLYRAWVSVHHPLPHGSDEQAGNMRLSPVGYGQLQMLLLNQSNTLEIIRFLLARFLGDGKTKPHLIEPPGHVDGNPNGRRTFKPSSFNGFVDMMKHL